MFSAKSLLEPDPDKNPVVGIFALVMFIIVAVFVIAMFLKRDLSPYSQTQAQAVAKSTEIRNR